VTEYSLPYGFEHLNFELPSKYCVDILEPHPPQPIADLSTALKDAFSSPLGNCKLNQYKDCESIGIAINDKTRPVPQEEMVPALLKHLQKLGFSKDTITLFVGTGTHAMTRDELPRILPEDVIETYPIIIHNCDTSPMIDLGYTSYGTPVKFNADYYEKNLKITVGNIEPHHFMGFSGGVKTAAIGLSSRETITQNHTMLVDDHAKTGLYFTNPMRQDLEEIGKKIGIHFTLGTLLNEQKGIQQVYFGNPLSVMKQAIPDVKEMFGISIPKPYDLVIASSGGMPKDINLYQAQKSITPAAKITKDGGWVILLAACPEGSGSKKFEDYVTHKESHQAIIHQFKDGYFEVGPHKAYQFAKAAVRVNLIIVSDLPPVDLKKWHLTPSTPTLLNSLLDWIYSNIPEKARIALLPNATHTMTEVKNEIK